MQHNSQNLVFNKEVNQRPNRKYAALHHNIESNCTLTIFCWRKIRENRIKSQLKQFIKPRKNKWKNFTEIIIKTEEV